MDSRIPRASERSNFCSKQKRNHKVKKEKKREFVVEFRETRTVMKVKAIKAHSLAEANEIAEDKYGYEFHDGFGNALESRIENVQPADEWQDNGKDWVSY
jgi:hypothetical protein